MHHQRLMKKPSPQRLPCGEAHAPQARGVHGLPRQVEDALGADVVIETHRATPSSECAAQAQRRHVARLERMQGRSEPLA